MSKTLLVLYRASCVTLLPLVVLLASSPPLVCADVRANDVKSCEQGVECAEIDVTADGESYNAPSLKQNDTAPRDERAYHHSGLGDNFVVDGSPMCRGLGDLMAQHCPRQLEAISASSDGGVRSSPEERFGAKQQSFGSEWHKARMREYLQKVVDYMYDEVFTKPEFAKVREKNECRNRDERCVQWGAEGECDANYDWMVRNCAPSCLACHALDIDLRCPRHEGVVNALGAGDLDRMFQRIIDPENVEIAQFKPVLHSRPAASSSLLDVESDVPVGPWVVTFDEFLTHEECDRLIELGYEMGYHRSTETGEEAFDGGLELIHTEARTSENAWCGDDCREEETAKRVLERMSNVTGIPPDNAEDLQLLKYEVGQFYKVHHDNGQGDDNTRCGPRILTFFLYLNDVESGGATQFPELNGLTVTPKKGTALLWPSVQNDDPTAQDERTLHEALVVEKGRKFAANAWFHLREYRYQSSDRCC